uniref:Uncharacterized protein AlNc14C244G9531 n=1 Tax=Albugo laibachii Nc14 TaxID=890382 RepID=F0WT47_9STRA|nr:conserved hypothetical protein [Albugo laibachii Nc14]|eukprot:CCA24534.1 conserved hypothetical protein [Albugo laibachii Nc14]
MIGSVKGNHFKWLQIYMMDKKSEESAYAALIKLCQRLALRHGISQQTVSETKQRSIELEGVKRKFSESFWNENSVVDPGGIINADETGIYYDMPPRKIWNIVGEQPKFDVSQGYSSRFTAVLGIKADEQKPPIMFIVGVFFRPSDSELFVWDRSNLGGQIFPSLSLSVIK